MTKLLLRLTLLLALCSPAALHAQSPSVYSIESEYTVQNGYRYFFDKINSNTGMQTRLAQMPVCGYYLGINAFFNHAGNYVFCGIDSATQAMPYSFNLYEVDTTGHVIHVTPMTSTTGAGPDLLLVFQSEGCPYYYGLKWYANEVRELVTIDPITGVDTLKASTTNPYHTIETGCARDADGNFYYVEQCGTTNFMDVYKADIVHGQILHTDSFPKGEHLWNAFYHCPTNTMYAFYQDSTDPGVSGSEWVKIDTAGHIVHTGTTFTGNGIYSLGNTVLSNGHFYQKNSLSTSISLDPAAVTGPTYVLNDNSIANLDMKLFAAAPTICNYVYDCVKDTVTNPEHVYTISTGNSISIYPNPADADITISASAAVAGSQYTISDITGRIVSQGKLAGKLGHVNISALQNGIYFLRLAGQNEKPYKLVKQ